MPVLLAASKGWPNEALHRTLVNVAKMRTIFAQKLCGKYKLSLQSAGELGRCLASLVYRVCHILVAPCTMHWAQLPIPYLSDRASTGS